MLIDKEKIAKAKQKIGIEKTWEIAKENLRLEKADDRNFKACCPFHNEDTPSFILNPKTMSFKCFGCGKSVDLIDIFVHSGDTYMCAVQKLFELADIKYSFGELGLKKERAYRYPHPEGEDGNKEQVYAYLEKRGISRETVDKADVTQDAEGNVVFNYFDENDVLCMCKYRPSRKIDKSKGDIKTWCQKDADTMPLLFHMNKINPSLPLIVSEGELDSLAIMESGWNNVVSVPFGAGNTAWIEHNFEWLEQFDSIIICSDNDEAGVKMRKEVIPRLGSWRTKYIDIPKTIINRKTGHEVPIKDMNEVLYYAGKEAVLDLIEHAEDPGVPSIVNVSEIQDIDLDEMDGINTGIRELDAEIMRLFYGTLTVVSGLPGCVDGVTEFFNGERWKKISEYAPGDKVLQYNADGTAELVTPLQYHKYPCERFYHLHTQKGIDQMLSDEHNVVYITSKGNLQKKSMKDLFRLHNESKTGFVGKFIPSFEFSGSGVKLTNEEIRLMCAVIADGTFNNTLSSNAKTYNRVRVNLKKTKKKERIVQLLRDAGYEYEEHRWNPKDPEYMNFMFYPPLRTKTYPKEWYGFSQEQKQAFLDEVLRWDGHVDKIGRMKYSTTVKDNADFVQFMFASSGYKATISTRNRIGRKHAKGDYTYKSVEYEVRISQKAHQLLTLHNSGTKNEIDVYEPKELQYKYCFTVPSGMLVLRRGNNINITGNSGKTSFLSQIACQSLEQNKPVWMFSREMPSWMEKNWLNYIMAGGHHINVFENDSGAKYYKIDPSVKDKINAYYDKRWFLYRDDWSNALDDLLSSMEDSVRKYGVKLLILDNLMTINIGSNENNDLQKQTDCVNKLIKFAMKYSVAVVLVAHPRKLQSGADIGIQDISGSANLTNLAHRTIGLRRIDKDKEKSNHDVVLTLIKDRMRGRSGKKINLYYDIPSRRFYTNESEYEYKYGWDSGIYAPLPYPHAEEHEVYGEV